MAKRFTLRALLGLSLAAVLFSAWPPPVNAAPGKGADEHPSSAAREPRLSAAAAGSIIAVVSGFRNRHGQLLLAVFDSDEGFPNDVKHAVYYKAFPIDADPLKVRIDDLPPGTYGVAIHHDEDGDFAMAKGLFGIPREGYGASNDAPARFGPPKFKHARFELKEGQVLRLPIHVRYF